MADTRVLEFVLRLLGLLAIIGGLAIIALSSSTVGAVGGALVVVFGGLAAHWARRGVARHR
jgi:hypothetical protein